MTSRVPEGISHQITCKISSSSPGQGQRCALDMTLKTKSVKYRTQILQEHRKSSKPIMEKRRRARINESLAQLKTLIHALNKDTSRHSKLEKADILEITVKHLKNLQQTASSFSTLEYRAGFSQCINEVLCFLSTHDGMDTEVKPLLLSHLRRCVPHLDFIPGQPQHHPRGRAVKPGLEPPAASPLHSPHLLFPSEASKTRSGFHLVPSNSGTLGVLIPGSSSVCLADHLHIAPLSGAFPNAQVNAQGFLWRPW